MAAETTVAEIDMARSIRYCGRYRPRYDGIMTSRKTHPVLLRLPLALHARIERLAGRDGVSRASTMVGLLWEASARREAETMTSYTDSILAQTDEHTIATVTMAQLDALRLEALEAGDGAQVELCDRALAGSESARLECQRVIADAEAQCDEGWCAVERDTDCPRREQRGPLRATHGRAMADRDERLESVRWLGRDGYCYVDQPDE
jgi:hypothetical protein